MKSQIKEVLLEHLRPNPYRDLDSYPWDESKLKALQRSFEGVGIWESIIARPVNGGYQIAFGHHRLEAARRMNEASIAVIIRDLTDEQMLQFMGRENMEDFRTEFLVMLNAWEAAVTFIGNRKGADKVKALDAAKLLGWTELHSKSGTAQLSEMARACASAHALIVDGWNEREDFAGLSVGAVADLAERAQSKMDNIERAAKRTGASATQVKKAKGHIAKGAKEAARGVREGRVAYRDIRAEVDVRAFEAADQAKEKQSPLFAEFARNVIDSLSRMLDRDTVATRLEQIAGALGRIEMDEDKSAVRQINNELVELHHRVDRWRKRLTPTNEKLVKFPALEGGKEA